MRRGRSLKSGCLMFLVLVFAAMAASRAHADVRVIQQAGKIRVEARDASISEVLTALGASYELANPGALASGPLNAIYSGSMGEVISRVLDGHDYTVRYLDGRPAIIIYGMSSKLSKSWVAAAAPNVAPATGSQSGNDLQRNGTTKAATGASKLSLPSSTGGQSGVISAMLTSAAFSQLPNSADGAASPSTPDLGALTQSAVSSLQNLAASLDSNVPKMCSSCAPSMDLPPPLPPDRASR
jgi:hypothetical protein